MNFLDIIALAWRNLFHSKLRTALTVAGVIVGVAAIITMVSLGIGLQNNLLRDALGRIDLFTQIIVTGPGADALLAMNEARAAGDKDALEPTPASDGDPTPAPTPIMTRMIDDAAIAELQSINGVRYAVPNFTFGTYIQFEGRTRRAVIGGAPISIDYNPRFKNFLAGRHLSGDEAQEAVVTERFMAWLRAKPSVAFDRRRRPRAPFQQQPSNKIDERRIKSAEEVIGKEIDLLAIPAKDAAPTSIFGIPLMDSLAGGSPEKIIEGTTAEGFEKRAYRIVGVLQTQEGFDINNFLYSDMFIPLPQARKYRDANRNPMERMGEMLAGDTGYQSAEVRVADLSQTESVENELKKRGFAFQKFGNQIEEIRRAGMIVNATLALISGIALLVASFGISNTMIMSIRERTREIGIMKAIGGSNGEIMRIFFVEASLIGLTGGVLGALTGWGTDRLLNAWANRYVARQVGHAIRYIEFFHIPWYLIAGAITFAALVSMIAAIYPALAAARVDPIKALRYE
ncbi:MAG: ABC transporter permease [Blastocatellia bacterium]|nr:ABC transporter permease [Blastocatellia bacterium]